MELRKPTLDDKEMLLNGVKEWSKSHDDTFEAGIAGSSMLVKYIDDYDGWLNLQEEIATNPKNGFVKGIQYILVDNNELIGFFNLRLELNEFLEQRGGHIGYGILPSKRRMGYAKAGLKLSLEIMKNYDINKVLVTCNSTNTGSYKTIEANGGVLENTFTEEDGNIVNRYWITL